MTRLDRVLEPLRVLGWRFPAVIVAANVGALLVALAWERWR